MITRLRSIITAVAVTLTMARDYNGAHRLSAADMSDFERRMRDLDRHAPFRTA